jgi:hypothetical protein
MLLRAFRRDFDVNGPSVVRIARTLLRGWQRHKADPDSRIRARYARECGDLATVYAGALWAAERWLAREPAGSRVREVRQSLVREFGLRARVSGPLLGRAILLGHGAREPAPPSRTRVRAADVLRDEPALGGRGRDGNALRT